MFGLQTETIIGIVAGWIFLSVIATVFLEGMWSFIQALKTLAERICSGLNAADQAVEQGTPRLQGDIQEVGHGVASFLQPVADGLVALLSALRSHWARVLASVAFEATSVHQRVMGALIYLMGIVAFLYADAALGFNTVAAITGKAGLPPPRLPDFLAFLTPLLRDITLPLVIAFVVNALILGVILADLHHHTDLARWPRTGGMVWVYRGIATINFVCVVVLALMFMMGRFVELSPSITLQTAQLLDGWANFAMNAITVPAIITTFLLWPAVFALLVLWLIAVGLTIATLGLVRGIVVWAQRASPLFASGSAMVAGWLSWIVRGTLKLLVFSVQVATFIIDIPAKLIEWCIMVIAYLPRQLGNWLTRFDQIAHTLKFKPGVLGGPSSSYEGAISKLDSPSS